MSEIFNTAFDVINEVRGKVNNCVNSNKISQKEGNNILQGFERRAEDTPTLLSQGLTQALTFYLYKVGDLKTFTSVYTWLFNNNGTDVCDKLDKEGYLLYTSVLFRILEKLKIPGVKCNIEDFSKDPQNLKTCLSNISENEAKVYRRLINYIIELKKISKIMIGETTTQASPQS